MSNENDESKDMGSTKHVKKSSKWKIDLDCKKIFVLNELSIIEGIIVKHKMFKFLVYAIYIII